MPTIRAYRSLSSSKEIIPVHHAYETDAYMCPWTGKIYATKEQYVKYLKILRKGIHETNAKVRLNKKLAAVRQLDNWCAVVNWINENGWLSYEIAKMYPRWGNSSKVPEDFKVEILYLRLRHSEKVSNSHHCPIGGVENWCGRVDGAPTSYPGWEGRIGVKFNHDIDHSGSDIMQHFRMLCGTGGGTRACIYGYDVRMFDADWPGITEVLNKRKEEHNVENVERILSSQPQAIWHEPDFVYGDKDPYLSR